jgi:hypothetical protein
VIIAVTMLAIIIIYDYGQTIDARISYAQFKTHLHKRDAAHKNKATAPKSAENILFILFNR